jgi:hypothetical protein
LHFVENTTFMFLCQVNTGVVQEQSKINSTCRGSIAHIVTWRLKAGIGHCWATVR